MNSLESKGYTKKDECIRAITHPLNYWGVIPDEPGVPISQLVYFNKSGDHLAIKVTNSDTQTTSLLHPDDPDYLRNIFDRLDAGADTKGPLSAGSIARITFGRFDQEVGFYAFCYPAANQAADYFFPAAGRPAGYFVSSQLGDHTSFDERGVSVYLNKPYRPLKCPPCEHHDRVYSEDREQIKFGFKLPDRATESELRAILAAEKGNWYEERRDLLAHLEPVYNSEGVLTSYQPTTNTMGPVVYRCNCPAL